MGSRDVNYHEYCSRVCCMYALKYGHLIREKTGSHTTVYNFYIDMRCFGKGHEAFYRRCQEEGIYLIRSKPAQINADPNPSDGQDRLVVIGEDTLLNRIYRLPCLHPVVHGLGHSVRRVAISVRRQPGDLQRLRDLRERLPERRGPHLAIHPSQDRDRI